VLAGQEVAMPLSFMINPKLPPDVRVVTLSYTFFDITAENPQASVSIESDLQVAIN
jgi:cytochrome c oxidase assembly protein subunit 11